MTDHADILRRLRSAANDAGLLRGDVAALASALPADSFAHDDVTRLVGELEHGEEMLHIAISELLPQGAGPRFEDARGILAPADMGRDMQ